MLRKKYFREQIGTRHGHNCPLLCTTPYSDATALVPRDFEKKSNIFTKI